MKLIYIVLISVFLISTVNSSESQFLDLKNDVELLKLKIEVLEQKVTEQDSHNSLHYQTLPAILTNYGNNPDGLSAFHYAIKKGDLNVVQFLLGYGVNPNSKDSECSALSRAALHNQIEVGKLLILYGADIAPCNDTLFCAIAEDNSDFIKMLADNNVDVFTFDKLQVGSNTLHFACMRGRYNSVVVLINLGADVNENTNFTSLDAAIRYLNYKDYPRCLDIIKLLIEKGAYRNKDHIPTCPVIRGYLESINVL